MTSPLTTAGTPGGTSRRRRAALVGTADHTVGRQRRPLVAALVLAGTCGLLAACGTTPAPGTRPTKTVTVQAGSGPSSATTTPAASSAPAGPPGCLANGLQASLGAAQGAAGTFYQVIVLTNTSAATCTLYGYPGVSFVTGVGGSTVGAPATHNSVDPKTLVTLAPGGQANMLLAVHDAGVYPPASCQPSSVDWLRIYPPGDYGSVFVQYPAQACASTAEQQLTVTPMRAGAGLAGP
jgi:Protein of unknown function (DUF4232)